MHCRLTIPITNFFLFLHFFFVVVYFYLLTLPTYAWWRSMMACGGSQTSWSRLMSQSQAMTSSPGSQGAATTISPAVPCWNSDTIPARTAGEMVSRAASAWPSIMAAIIANRLPGGSVAVILRWVSITRVKSTLTLSSSLGPRMALFVSSSCCRQRLARSMCPCARGRKPSPSVVDRNPYFLLFFCWLVMEMGIFPVYILVKAWNSPGVDPQKVLHQSGVTIRLSHGLSLDFIGYWSFDTMYIAQCCPVPIKCDEN